MSERDVRPSEADVIVERDAARALTLKALAVITIPLILALLWLGVLREQSLKYDISNAVAQAAVEQRAATLASQVGGLNARVQALAGRLPDNSIGGDRPDLLSVFPEAVSTTIIPLGELGTVNLSPDQLGHTSHIGIDLVRRAYAGELAEPEAVSTDSGWLILYASAYGESTAQGVLLVEVDGRTFDRSLGNSGDVGRFALAQQRPSDSPVIAGSAIDRDHISARVKVANTPWELQFQPSDGWLNKTTPHWLGVFIPSSLAFLGLALGCFYLLRGKPQLLSQEVDRILEGAELRSPIKLQVQELLPLAQLLRKLSLLSRRQLISAARSEKEHPAQTIADDTETRAVVSTPDSSVAGSDLDDPEVINDGIPAHIFRAYDIRGDVNTELTIDLVEKIGNAIAVLAPQKGITTLLVAHDARPSSERIRTVLVKALLAGGVDVMDIGLAPAPLLYFGTHETEFRSGIMITGSHHDDSINGLKLIFDHSVVSGDGIDEILSTIRAGHKVTGKGHTIKRDLEADYVDKVAMDVGVALPQKVVVDNHFGAAGVLAPDLFLSLGCEVISINAPRSARDDTAWNLGDALTTLGEKVVAEGADLGVLFDSDGDRIHTVTNRGTAVTTDRLLMILAQDVLERNPGADIVYDVKCSQHFAPFITRAGGRALMSRSGHAFIREKVRETGALLGGEFAGHVFFVERWYGFDDGIYAAARLLEVLGTASESYDALLNKLPPSVSTPEIILPAEPKLRRKVMRGLAANADFPGARITTLDGLRIDYSDGWGLVRSSNTEEALAFRFEANDETSLTRVQHVLRKAIHKHAPDLALPF